MDLSLPDNLLRRFEATDQAFLFSLFYSVRQYEFMAQNWPALALEQFLRQQFDLQSQSYQQNYPNALRYLILDAHHAVGQIYLNFSDQDIHLIDFTILPEYQNRGLGSRLLQWLTDLARQTHRSISLQVMHHNPAMALYHRFGFRIISESAPYLLMCWERSYHQ